MRVAIVVGTRPEAIKLAPVVAALRRRPGLTVRVIATAQHREMLDCALASFGIATDFDLDLMAPAQDLTAFAARCLAALGDCFARERPDYVLAQGDTTTVLCAGLAAAYAGIDFGHVEAGLRSGARDPFPEELNRALVARMAIHHFCPTPAARANLLREGIDGRAVHVTGNTVIDALLATVAALPPAPSPPAAGDRLLFVTLHRRENQSRIADVVGAVRTLIGTMPALRVLWPVHPNPAVGRAVRDGLAGCPRVTLSAPLDYRACVTALRDCWAVLTDSGGLQEEAPALGRPVLVLRRETERPEGVVAGVARLVGTEAVAIVAAVSHLADDAQAYAAMAQGASPYGDGHAGERIADIVAGHGEVR